ncbi:MAG: phosphoribosylanthranilate isomerase [Pseudomonadota bacterium]
MKVKICGLTRPEDVAAAAKAGADYLGFIFFPPSPRFISPDQAGDLMRGAPDGVAKVAVTVDPDDELIDQLRALPVDVLQLHGRESPERVSELKRRTGLPVIKALGIREAADLDQIDRYAPVADQLLLDSKPPKEATRPGGNALSFDWRLLSNRTWPLPWLLSGGLTAENIAEAIRITGATQLDLSSAVESAPGIKDHVKIRRFIETARSPTLSQ